MARQTVSLDPTIEKSLRRIQGTLIVKFEREYSFTTIVNMVLLGGLVGSGKFDEEVWDMINQFLNDRQENLDLEAAADILISRVVHTLSPV